MYKLSERKKKKCKFGCDKTKLIRTKVNLKYGHAIRISCPSCKRRKFTDFSTNNPFYDSAEWKSLRHKALMHYPRQCVLCNDTKGPFHVDHIKPRSKYPELEYSFDNLQVLCRDCNLGKGANDETDFRPKVNQV